MRFRPNFTDRLRAALVAVALASCVSTVAASVRIEGVEYEGVDAFASSNGLKAFWSKPKETLVLRSDWTRLELNADSREVRLNDIRLLLGDGTVFHRGELQLSVTDGRLFLGPILSAKRVAGPVPAARTVVIDAGHGGKDTGTSNPKLGFQEKGFALAVARELRSQLESAGFRVVMTREDDTFIPLEGRPAVARRANADLFVSIHFNAITNAAIAGAETYVLTPRGQRSTGAESGQPADAQSNPGDAFDAWNSILGYRVHRQIIGGLKSFDRGLKRARFVVLRELSCPGILVEGGYLTNDAEARRIASPEWRVRLAKAIAEGIIEYRDVLDQARRK